MDAELKKNNSPVSVTPALRQKLRWAFNQRFKSVENFLNKWRQQSDTLGEPPSEAEVQNIL
jgi:hypothetical protein